MKTFELGFLWASLGLAARLLAAEAPAGSGANANTPSPAISGSATSNAAGTDAPTTQPATGAPTEKPADTAAQPAAASTNGVPLIASENGTNGLRIRFRGAPLNLVLDYLSDAAGFIINKETEVRGTVDVWSKEPVSKDEAVELLNSVLKKNGYALVRNGRILNIVSMENVKTSDTEIENGNKWENVDKSDEVVTQIIPVRYASATQLMNNLQVLLPTSANLSVNESANSLILVATKRDIRRMLKIVGALDSSIANVSTIKVFTLRYADAKQLVTVVQQLFTPQGVNQGGGMRAQLFNMMRGGGFGGPGGPGGGAPGGGGSAGGGTGSKVTAAADDYSNSLIVSASSELMATIADMVKEIDQPMNNITELQVFHLLNADPTEVADQLTELFPDDTKSATTQNQGGGFRFGGGRGFGGPFGGGGQTTISDRTIKKTRVLAVPDPRSSSLLVSAPSDLMPQITQMIEKLDSSTAKREVVRVYDLQNADPQDVNQILQDLFQRSGNVKANNNNQRTSLLGTGNPLTQRATQQQTTTTSTSTFGTGTGTGARGGF